MTEPTQPADCSRYEPTQTGIPPPPPPPNTRRPWWHIGVPVLMVVALIALILVPHIAFSKQSVPATHIDPGATEAAQVGATQRAADTATASVPTPTPHPTIIVETPTAAPTPTATQSTGYTAEDIFAQIQAVDSTAYIQSTNETIWAFSHDNYYVTVHATSSVHFSGCPSRNCADTPHFGIWVYASSQEAYSAWQQVFSDSLSCTDTSPYADGMWVACGPNEYEAEYAHGRCLLLNADAYSTYGQVVTQYCGQGCCKVGNKKTLSQV